MKSAKETAEIIGLFAILVGLVFVGLELRQGQRGLQAQIRAMLAQIDIEQIRSTRQDDRLLEQLISDRPQIGSIEEFRFQLYLRELARTAEHHFYQHRVGTFQETEFEGVKALWKSRFSLPRYRAWWELNKGEFSTDFREEFDTVLSER